MKPEPLTPTPHTQFVGVILSTLQEKIPFRKTHPKQNRLNHSQVSTLVFGFHNGYVMSNGMAPTTANRWLSLEQAYNTRNEFTLTLLLYVASGREAS